MQVEPFALPDNILKKTAFRLSKKISLYFNNHQIDTTYITLPANPSRFAAVTRFESGLGAAVVRVNVRKAIDKTQDKAARR